MIQTGRVMMRPGTRVHLLIIFIDFLIKVCLDLFHLNFIQFMR